MNLTIASLQRMAQASRERLSFPRRNRLADIASLGILLLWLVLGRWDSVLYPLPLNADEAQAGANALRILHYGYSWNAVDGHTAGPLNSILLTWPALVGKDVTLNTIHLTAFLLVFGFLSLTYYSIKVVSNAFVALTLSMPLAIFYGYTRHADFLHYSSELLPVFLLSVAFYVSLRAIRSGQVEELPLRDCLVTGLALGLTPFAKLQSAPMVLVIIMVMAWIIKRQKNARAVKFWAFALAGVAPLLILMAPLVARGTFQDFYFSYIRYAGLYVRKPLYLFDIQKLLESHLILKHVFHFYVEVMILGIVLFLVRNRSRHTERLPALIYTACVTVAALLAIATPGWRFLHYLTLLMPFMAILAAVTLSLNYENRHIGLFQKGFGALVFLHILLIGVMPEYGKGYYFRYLNRYNTPLKAGFSFTSPRVYDWIPGDNRSLLVWGWMPQWYLLAGDAPASRESHTERQIKPTPLTGYYRQRLIKDLALSEPSIIIDAVAGKSFGFHEGALQGPQMIPELADKLKQEYQPLSQGPHSNGECPRIHITKARHEALEDSIVRIRDISGPKKDAPEDANLFSAEKLNDNSVTEDTCFDFWLAPHNTLPTLSITFEKPEAIASFRILNTRYRDILDRETGSLRLALLHRGAIVHSEDIPLDHYPYWNVRQLKGTVLADSARIEILSFRGPGAGLNEIKFYKHQSSVESTLP